MNTMTLTKVAASLCGAFLVLLLGQWAAGAMYSTGSQDGKASYVIDTGENDAATEEANADQAEAESGDLMATADIGKGAKVFKKCKACHKLEDGANGVGPYLYGVVDREVASAGGFKYSAPMMDKGGVWSVEELDAFLTKPKDVVPGTKMSFSGLKSAEDRANVIAYLDSLDN